MRHGVKSKTYNGIYNLRSRRPDSLSDDDEVDEAIGIAVVYSWSAEVCNVFVFRAASSNSRLLLTSSCATYGTSKARRKKGVTSMGRSGVGHPAVECRRDLCYDICRGGSHSSNLFHGTCSELFSHRAAVRWAAPGGSSQRWGSPRTPKHLKNRHPDLKNRLPDLRSDLCSSELGSSIVRIVLRIGVFFCNCAAGGVSTATFDSL